MKILQVSKLYSPWIGGVETIVQQIVEGLNNKDNFKIEVLCIGTRKAKRTIDKVNGVKIWLAKSWGIFWGMPLSFDFFGFFKKLSRKVDIIAFHHPFPLGDLAIFLFKPKAKLIVHYHSDIVRQKILEVFFRPLIFNTLKRARKIVVSNPNLIKSSSYLQKFKNKCIVIPFGVDFKEIENNLNKQEIGRIREKYGNFVLFVGRLSYYKGIYFLIEAMKNVGANLVIIGEGLEKEKLELKVKSLRLEDRIFFLPHQEKEKIINFYTTAKVFVLPSIYKSEAFGIVLIEAMACATPVISTELGTGTSWVNINGQTGLVVLPKNSQSLTQAIKKILRNKELAQKMGQNALRRTEENFTLQKMIKDYKRLYEE